MALKPWYDVVKPRNDLKQERPLDASEFAVHLDHIRDGRAPDVYQQPERFFERTYLTPNLSSLAAEVLRRLSGERTETSAVFNMATQFGGGKTHALTVLYHLAKHGGQAERWQGVRKLMSKAGVSRVPQAAVAVFVGTEFDSLIGRGGDDGTPRRRTPWGEIAYQLSGDEGLAVLAEHEEHMVAPGGDAIRKFLPKDRPSLILMDELMNYISRQRQPGSNQAQQGLVAQLYNFLQVLSEEARARNDLVLAVSVPASELEMNADDYADYERLKKLLDRLGKAVVMSVEAETSEIIRRRLFEWEGLPREVKPTIRAYAEWVEKHRQQLPGWFPADQAEEAFAATYPFHPVVLSVFERKWQSLPKFQRTRGVLRLLALWVSRAYRLGYEGHHRDPLISLGTAPLDDAVFRQAMLEQLGETRLEVAVGADIDGRADSHARRLDDAAIEEIKEAKLHRKAATSIFFESNGGQARAVATEPEIRLAVSEPDLNIGNLETVLDALNSACYYLNAERRNYRFSLTPTLNKLLADYRGKVHGSEVTERVRAEVVTVLSEGPSLRRVFFPVSTSDIPDRLPTLALVVAAPDQVAQDPAALPWIERFTREHGSATRSFRSGLIWLLPDESQRMDEPARRLLAWEAILDDEGERLADDQRRTLEQNISKARRDLKEAVWQTYKHVYLLGKDNRLRHVDMGLINSSAGPVVMQVLNRLRQDGDVEEKVGVSFLLRNWAPAFAEWPTVEVRNAFFASPVYPRLLNPDTIRETIARGVAEGKLGYVGIDAEGRYEPFYFGESLSSGEVEISDEMYIIQGERAQAYLTALQAQEEQDEVKPPVYENDEAEETTETTDDETDTDVDEETVETLPTLLRWQGVLPSQKWSNFYQRVLTKLVSAGRIRLEVFVEAESSSGVQQQLVNDIQVALRELGLEGDVEVE